jgi:hypothetical protein
MKGQKHSIFNKIGYMDLCASILQFHHHHLIPGELNPHEPFRSSLNCSLAFVATNQHLQGTNEVRRLQQEDTINNMNKLGNNNMEGKKLGNEEHQQRGPT